MAEPSTTRATRRRAWRGIRSRLVAVLLIPTIAALALGGLRLQAAMRDSADATRTSSIASALPDSFRLALQLQVERDAGSSSKVTAKSLQLVRHTTDSAVNVWRTRLQKIDSSRNADLRRDLDTISAALDDMEKLRSDLSHTESRLVGITEYTNTLNRLLGLGAHLPDMGSQGNLYRQAMGLGQVRTAAEALASQRVIVTRAIADGKISQFNLTALATATEAYKRSSGFFRDNTSVLARAQFDRINEDSLDRSGSDESMQSAIASLLSTGNPASMHLTAAKWTTASQSYLALVSGAIATAAEDLAHAVDERRAAAQHDAIVSAATVLLVLLLALLGTVVVARSILQPLQRLREAALDIARHGLPERVRAMEDSDEADDLSVEPIHVGSRDEIAEVAEAFDAVHAEAVRLAGEQALMRANVNRMFVNLSRRSQSLVERQLRLIDELESGEQDPEHLANLFRLDHLATRMRRNDESLMVLAGGDTGQGARGPVPVLDVLRAASSEVEQFARVEIESGEAAKFRGSVAGDLVHLLAELIENATNFSPPDSTVVVRSTRTSPTSPLVVEVRDVGIGMSTPELDAANEKLRSAGGLDADVARMMGLVVASRLADRHGLSVELRPNSPRGVVARVEVPTNVLVEPEQRYALPGDAFDPTVPAEAFDPVLGEPEQRLLEEQPEPVAFDPLSAPMGHDPLESWSPEPFAPAEPAVGEPFAPVWPDASEADVEEPVGTEPDRVEPSAPAAFSDHGFPTLPKRQANMIPPAPRVEQVSADPAPAAPPTAPAAAAPETPARPAVRPPDGYTPPTTPIASQPPVKNWFTTTVPLRDPEELLNTYLTGRAEGVDGAIKSPLGSIPKRAQPIVDPFAKPRDPGHDDLFLPAKTEEPPAPAPLTSSGLPTRIPRTNLPAGLAPESTFDAFGSATPATPAAPPSPDPAPAASVAPVEAAPPAAPADPEEPAEPAASLPSAELLQSVPLVRPVATPSGPVLDPLIAELAADVLNAPSAAEAFNLLEDEEDDDSSIFAELQSEWFTRRTPLEARRSQAEPVAGETASGKRDWVSPGDDGWRRAAELSEPAVAEDDSPLTADGLPMRVPGRNLVPGSATPPPATPAPAAENVVPLPRLERRRTRGLSSFQQGVSRARTTDTPESADHSEEITVLGAYEASENRAHEEHQ